VAVGIFVFCIVAVVGLLTVSLKTDRLASVDTQLALMTEVTSSILKNQGFANVSTNSLYTGASPALYFNSSGQVALDSNNKVAFATQKSDSVYACTITCRQPASFNPYISTSTNLLYLQLRFGWPATAPTANQATRIVNMTMVNYD
jgi:hypothetical protein